jgi:membrane-bound ClpP family serine protease
MKKRFYLRLTVILLIGVLLLLSGHTHPHNYLISADHCILCQILQCGFTNVVSFILTLFLIGIVLILPETFTPSNFYFLTVNDSRASPVNLPLYNF